MSPTQLNRHDHDHRRRVEACQDVQPCGKQHRHSVACYAPRTVFVVLLAFLQLRRG